MVRLLLLKCFKTPALKRWSQLKPSPSWDSYALTGWDMMKLSIIRHSVILELFLRSGRQSQSQPFKRSRIWIGRPSFDAAWASRALWNIRGACSCKYSWKDWIHLDVIHKQSWGSALTCQSILPHLWGGSVPVSPDLVNARLFTSI